MNEEKVNINGLFFIKILIGGLILVSFVVGIPYMLYF